MIIYQCDMCGCTNNHPMPIYEIKFSDCNCTPDPHRDRKMICFQCGQKLIDLINHKIELAKKN